MSYFGTICHFGHPVSVPRTRHPVRILSEVDRTSFSPYGELRSLIVSTVYTSALQLVARQIVLYGSRSIILL